jgi:uncharacterized membrane protein (UPF0127 family)
MKHWFTPQNSGVAALALVVIAGGCTMTESTPAAIPIEPPLATAAPDAETAPKPAAEQASTDPKIAPPSSPHVTIRTQSGALLRVDVEIATTPRDRQRGLMYRDQLADGRGMLFIMDAVRIHSFWMKHTRIPLDMLFLSPEGEIVGIVESAEPLTLTPRRVSLPSLYVLEVPGSWCRRNRVKKGDRVDVTNHSLFPGSSQREP